MGLLYLEALGAMLVLVLIVWWTMFAGRNKGEPPRYEPTPDPSLRSGAAESPAPPQASARD